MQISIWEQETFFAERAVIIIGAGLCGLWCAHDLKIKHPRLNILVLEKGSIPAGASTRNAGFACFGSPTELLHDAAVMGAPRMWEIAEMRYKGIQKIQQLFGNAVIDYDNCGGFECLLNGHATIPLLIEKLPWLNEGLQDITGARETFVWANDKMQRFGLSGFDAMLENRLEGALHSGKLVRALTQKVHSLGVEILTGIDIQHYEEQGEKVILTAVQNQKFCARKLIVCSNAFSARFFKKPMVTPARGQILVTSPISGLALRGTFHFDEGFYYFRNVGNRLLLGGARNHSMQAQATTMFDTTTLIQNELERFIQTHLLPAQAFTIDYRWSGIMAFTEDKQPLVTPLTGNVTAVVACNGMGVALSPMISQLLPF